MTPAAYDLADQLFQLAPWEWMDETSLIALDDPQTGRRDHISIMGMAGDHLALAVYLGPEARHRFNLVQESPDSEHSPTDEDTYSLILDTPHLQCSFSERGDLFRSELALIKKAGRKYRGENWPTFRTFRPGHCSSPANDDEIRILMTAIEQILTVAPELGRDTGTFRSNEKNREILTRRKSGDHWETCWTPDDSTLFEFPRPTPAASLLEKVRQHPQALPIEVHFQLIPAPIGKSREASTYPYMLLVIDPESGSILGMEMLSVETTPYDELIASIPDVFLRLCDRISIRPSSIAVVSTATANLLHHTAYGLEIPLHLEAYLPATEEALESMMGFMSGGS